jgi:hypothetical protein
MKSVFVIEKTTGKQFVAVYALNSGGNLRFNVNGKFYTDKQFNKLFKIVTNE